jgi:zona occludens toxin
MIELYTGIPGAGKTLSMVQRLSELLESWDKNPEKGRPIFVHGIPDLALAHSPMPTLEKSEVVKNKYKQKAEIEVETETSAAVTLGINNKVGVSIVPDWDAMPDGSLVLIDEAQSCFPPRSALSTPSYHVAWLNVHRHRGFDIWLTTQHPKLIDGSARALVGRHQHFRRLFGGSRAIVYEFDACCDNLSNLKTAVTSHWSYPKKVYKWYKSAEVHTKQKFKLPKWLLIFPLGIALAFIFVPRSFSVITSIIAGKGLNAENSPAPVLPAAGVAEETPVIQMNYFLNGHQCFGVLKNGTLITEPQNCREKLKS